MKKIVFLILLFFISFNNLFSQLEASNWNFGKNVSIKFDTKGITETSVGNSDFFEGNSTISDKDGNLLFYTDNVFVFNKNKEVMKNGSGLGTYVSSTQSALIIKQPESDSLYYIFTTTNDENDGAKYCIVDMSLDNGLGEIVERNNKLFTNCSEKLTATLHQNKKDIWIVFHKWGNNEFYSYLLTGNGLNETPVISSIGTPHSYIDVDSFFKTKDKAGSMKLNPQGNKIGLVNFLSGLVELFDFDNSTGKISNPINLSEIIEKSKPDSVSQFRKIFWPYGCEFSPNGKMFYFAATTTFAKTLGFENGTLFQIDIENIDPNAIGDEYKKWTSELPGFFRVGAIQLGIDCRLYQTQEHIYGKRKDIYLHFLDNPNLKYNGSNLIIDSILIADSSQQIIRLGLPNFLTNYLDPEYINKEEFDYGKIKTKILMPSQAGEPGELTYLLPVNLIYQIPNNYIKNSNDKTYKLQLKIRYNSLLFRSDKFFNNNIIGKKFEVESEILDLEFGNIKFTKEKDSIKIGEFLGYFLLSEIKNSNIEILEFKWQEESLNNDIIELKEVMIPTDTTIGKLSLNGVCAENLKLLKFFQPTELKVYIENNSTIAKLVTMSKGNFDLNIYNLEGQLIENIILYNNQKNLNKDEIYTKDINLSQLLLNKNNMLNNIYFLELIIEGKKYTKKIFVEN